MEKGCWNMSVGIWLAGKWLLEQGCQNMVVGESLPELGCLNMVGGKRRWNKDVGIWLLWNLAGTEVAEYGRWTYSCLIVFVSTGVSKLSCRILTFINLMKNVKNSCPRASNSNYQNLACVFIS
jgi:hypothetical protein